MILFNHLVETGFIKQKFILTENNDNILGILKRNFNNDCCNHLVVESLLFKPFKNNLASFQLEIYC